MTLKQVITKLQRLSELYGDEMEVVVPKGHYYHNVYPTIQRASYDTDNKLVQYAYGLSTTMVVEMRPLGR